MLLVDSMMEVLVLPPLTLSTVVMTKNVELMDSPTEVLLTELDSLAELGGFLALGCLEELRDLVRPRLSSAASRSLAAPRSWETTWNPSRSSTASWRSAAS